MGKNIAKAVVLGALSFLAFCFLFVAVVVGSFFGFDVSGLGGSGSSSPAQRRGQQQEAQPPQQQQEEQPPQEAQKRQQPHKKRKKKEDKRQKNGFEPLPEKHLKSHQKETASYERYLPKAAISPNQKILFDRPPSSDGPKKKKL